MTRCTVTAASSIALTAWEFKEGERGRERGGGRERERGVKQSSVVLRKGFDVL